jgi:hypothetical protein
MRLAVQIASLFAVYVAALAWTVQVKPMEIELIAMAFASLSSGCFGGFLRNVEDHDDPAPFLVPVALTR